MTDISAKTGEQNLHNNKIIYCNKQDCLWFGKCPCDDSFDIGDCDFYDPQNELEGYGSNEYIDNIIEIGMIEYRREYIEDYDEFQKEWN